MGACEGRRPPPPALSAFEFMNLCCTVRPVVRTCERKRSLEPTLGGSGGQMRPKSQEDTEKLVRRPFVDPPLGAVVEPKTEYFPDFVVSFSAYFFEGLTDPFGDRIL